MIAPYGDGMPSNPDPLAFYRRPSPMTAIDLARHGRALEALGPDPYELAEAVQGVLVHRDWAPAMGLELPAERLADQHVRPVDEVIGRVLELSPEPLRVRRQPADRMVGVCRHFTVLHVALLRFHGIPARARAGFARYFGPGWVDHWVTERWDGRWVRHDAQIDTPASEALDLDFDHTDQPRGQFLTGSEAWRLCRSGRADPEEFGIFDMHGLWFVLGDLFLDLAAMNKVELLPWDGLGQGPAWRPDDGELDELDRLAAVIDADRLADIRREHQRRPVPPTIISFVDGVPTPVELGPLAVEAAEDAPV